MKVVLIVEGINDAKQIHKAFKNNKSVATIITEGTKVDNKTTEKINDFINRGYVPYILSDPDSAGDALAEMIQISHPDIDRLIVDDKECGYFTGKKIKSGIEHASYEYLRSVISPLIGVEYKRKQSPICWD